MAGDPHSPYGYVPTTYVCIIFVVLFSLTTLAHIFQAGRSRMWWLFPTLVTCGAGEVIGWVGRLWSSYNVNREEPFYMQITCTIIAPSFMTAAMFIMFGRIITFVGDEFSWLRPRTYSIIFIVADLIALVVQSVGGAQASAAPDMAGAEQGANIMVAGIIVQMAAITVYCIIQIDYLRRVWLNRPVRKSQASAADKEGSATTIAPTGLERLSRAIRMMILGLAIATLWIYVRSIYRTIELLGGWNGKVFVNEKLFNTLDGMPIFLAMLTLNVFHAGKYIPMGNERGAKEIEVSKA